MVKHICMDGEWKTHRGYVRNCKALDIEPLQRVLRSLYEDYNWFEISREPYDADYFTRLLCSPPLPPRGTIDRHQCQAIFDRKRDRCLGWFEYYDGYPARDTLWIAALFLHPREQGRGLGRELVSELLRRVDEQGKYRTVGVGILLRNWPALQFWHRLGFDRITRIRADRFYGEDMQGVMTLERARALPLSTPDGSS
jgi:GNAT superfamily N-acetyltransferase